MSGFVVGQFLHGFSLACAIAGSVDNSLIVLQYQHISTSSVQ